MTDDKCVRCGKPMKEHMLLDGGEIECPEGD